jgi:hypothetical protein
MFTIERTYYALATPDEELAGLTGRGCCDDMTVAIRAGFVDLSDDAEGDGKLVGGVAVVRSSAVEIAGIQASRCPWCWAAIEGAELREIDATAGQIVVL